MIESQPGEGGRDVRDPRICRLDGDEFFRSLDGHRTQHRRRVDREHRHRRTDAGGDRHDGDEVRRGPSRQVAQGRGDERHPKRLRAGRPASQWQNRHCRSRCCHVARRGVVGLSPERRRRGVTGVSIGRRAC